MKFKASMDWLTKAMTALITILFAVILVVKVFLLYGTNRFEAIPLGLFIVGIYFYCFLLRPICYFLTPDVLRIRRALKDVTIRLEIIRSVRQFAAEERRFTIRTFGVGGLFGYFGRFRNLRIGNLTMYATRGDKAVLVETTEGEKIIITPDEPDVFVNILTALKCGKIGENTSKRL